MLVPLPNLECPLISRKMNVRKIVFLPIDESSFKEYAEIKSTVIPGIPFRSIFVLYMSEYRVILCISSGDVTYRMYNIFFVHNMKLE